MSPGHAAHGESGNTPGLHGALPERRAVSVSSTGERAVQQVPEWAVLAARNSIPEALIEDSEESAECALLGEESRWRGIGDSV